MSAWMINIRMRRIEEVARHKRCDREVGVKCYQGPNRTYMLHDSQVHPDIADAQRTLRTQLQKIHADREAKQQKLSAEIRALSREIEVKP